LDLCAGLDCKSYDSASGAFRGDDAFISEYGPSDSIYLLDEGEDQEDLPHDPVETGQYHSGVSDASENNAEDLEGGSIDPEEG
jgi:hypothetical protein